VATTFQSVVVFPSSGRRLNTYPALPLWMNPIFLSEVAHRAKFRNVTSITQLQAGSDMNIPMLLCRQLYSSNL
jgi:hypothetical protein